MKLLLREGNAPHTEHATLKEPKENKRALRVLTLTTVDITLEKLLSPLIHALRDAGFTSECASSDGPHAAQLRAEGFQVHRIPLERRILTVRHAFALLRLIRLLRKREYDVVHVHTPVAQVLGRIAAKVTGVPIVLYTSHGFQFHDSRSWWARKIIIEIERRLARWTNVILTQSMEDAESAVQHGIGSRDQVIWIGNGVQLERFRPGPTDMSVREEFNLEAHHRVVGFIGRIVREKGVVELIEAMSRVIARFPSAKLLIVGDTLSSDGDTAAKKIVHDAIRALELQEEVRFAGMRDDVPRLLRAMDVFTLPSWREGMPRSIIEAMATGLPVVATDIRGCREEVVHGETGLLVPPKRSDRLADAILTLISDPQRADEMGARGRQRALEWFDERKVVQRQISLYEQLARRNELIHEAR